MTEEEIKIMQEENASLKTAKEAMEKELNELKEKHTKLETSKSEVDKKYLELLESNRQIITNGVPLPDEDNSPDKVFAELFKNL